MEVIAACLAGDLQLPIPKPYLVEIDPQWASFAPGELKRQLSKSDCSRIAFGSTLVTGGYAIWSLASRVSVSMMPTALAVFAFDAAINNFDRRFDKPNCLVKGDEIRIIDHELAFMTKGLIGWQEPWKLGGLKVFETPGKHIFREALRGKEHDYRAIKAAWTGLSDTRLKEYESALPSEWYAAKPVVNDALELIRGVRDNVDAFLKEVERVLK